MTNLVRCPGCREYGDREGMSKVGLGYVCNAACVELVKDRARKQKAKRQQARRPHITVPNGDQRRRVRKRDGNRCRWCGSTFFLNVHHIEYLSQGGGNFMHNLITLCRVHHEIVHSNKGLWQPILRATIWLTYDGKFMTIPEVQAYVEKMP